MINELFIIGNWWKKVKQNCFNVVFVKEYQSIHTVLYISARLYNPISRWGTFCSIGNLFFVLLSVEKKKVKENQQILDFIAFYKMSQLLWKWGCISDLNRNSLKRNMNDFHSFYEWLYIYSWPEKYLWRLKKKKSST